MDHLKMWSKYAKSVAMAAKRLYPQAKVYVIGGVASGKITVLSDIDLLIVLPEVKDRVNVIMKIFKLAVDEFDLPWDAPVELHVVNGADAERYLEREHVEVKA